MPAALTAYTQVLVAQDSALDGVFRRTCPRVRAIAESALIALAPDSLAAKIGSREATRACGKEGSALSCWISVSVDYNMAWEVASGRLDRSDVPREYTGLFRKADQLRTEVRARQREGFRSLIRSTTFILADSISVVSRSAGVLGGNGRLALTGLRQGDALVVLVRDSGRAEGARLHVRPADSVLTAPYDSVTFDLAAPCRRTDTTAP